MRTTMMTEDSSGEGECVTSAARALHKRLVAYAHLVAGDPENRSGVWVEHSYARARDRATTEVRELLVATPSAPPPGVDVERVPRAEPLLLPGDELDPDTDDEDEDEWEERVVSQATSGVQLRVSNAAVEALKEMRLARLASAGVKGGAGQLRREQARAAARRLRLAMAPVWATGASGTRLAAWLHGTLCTALPRRHRALYDEALAELRRSVPRLAERFSAQLPPVPLDPLEPADDVQLCGEDEEALLVWVCTGGAADERWLRRMRTLIPTHELRAVGGVAPRAAPDRWCASLAASVRTQLNELLADIGSRFVVLGGIGAGAALCATIAAGAGAGGGNGTSAVVARPRALLMLAPPLYTAEGPRDEPDDILHELRIPVLTVAGGGGAACGRSAAAELSARGSRRLLLLGGADDALRVPPTLRRRLRLPQHALDAAVADECARWIREVVHGRHERHERNDRQTTGMEIEGDGYVHSPAPTTRASGTRLVSRVSGSTPLALVPPRRVPEQLDPVDILQLPIVFADDEHPALVPSGTGASKEPHGAEGALTVRSGARGKLTRVIVARRADPGPRRAVSVYRRGPRGSLRPALRARHARHAAHS